MAAMSNFLICIIASNVGVAAAGLGLVIACVRAISVIRHDNPHLSWREPYAFSLPPLPTIAFQLRSVTLGPQVDGILASVPKPAIMTSPAPV